MNTIHTLFLEALGAALRSEPVQWTQEITPEEWEDLFSLADSHRVLPMIFQACYRCPAAAGGDPATFRLFRMRTMQAVTLQTQKTAEFLPILSALAEAGTEPLVIKGIVCRNLFPNPDYRLSSDEDILIPPEKTQLCHSVLSRFGLTTEDPDSTAYELAYQRANSYQYIEIHRSLFPEGSPAYGDLNRFFDQIRSRAVTLQGIPTLSPTDHMLYLILHAYKHFLHSGFGIRQVCDMVLLGNAYGGELEWDWILDCCRQIRAEQFAAALFRIGRKYLNFSLEDARYPLQWQAINADETSLLEDMLCSGVHGASDMSRKHSSTITLEAVAAQNRGGQTSHGLLKSVFPSARDLEGRYPYLKTKPLLLPVAWADRLLKYHRESLQDKTNNPGDSIRIGNERLGLLRQYGIIDP